MIRERNATPDSSGSRRVLHRADVGRAVLASGSQCTQSATVGQVWVAALEPTTRPKCPARIITS
jgi:hypothetical protein